MQTSFAGHEFRKTKVMDLRSSPPLNAVRAFAAAGRHLNLKTAAAELRVTPGAVSQQVQRLEAMLGRALFRRTARGLVLTEAGSEYWRAVSSALAQIGEATDRIRPTRKRRVLTLSATPLFAMKWLLPRLHRFTQHHRDVDVRIAATLDLADFRSDGVDLAVRHGDGRYPGLQSDLLFRVALFPVVGPALLAQDRALERPEDLAGCTLLHDVSCNDWVVWLKAHRVRGVDGGKGLMLSDGALTIEA